MRLSRKMVSGIVAGVAILTIGGTAFAYLTATGTANGAVTTGSSSPWKIDGLTTSGGNLLPGNGFQQAIGYTITNVSGGVQNLGAVTAAVPTASDGSVVGIPGCPANSFYVMTSFNNQDFAPLGEFNGGASKTGKVILGMNNLHVNQDACQNQSIPVTISAS
jgi:uncharacterized protein YraI